MIKEVLKTLIISPNDLLIARLEEGLRMALKPQAEASEELDPSTQVNFAPNGIPGPHSNTQDFADYPNHASRSEAPGDNELLTFGYAEDLVLAIPMIETFRPELVVIDIALIDVHQSSDAFAILSEDLLRRGIPLIGVSDHSSIEGVGTSGRLGLGTDGLMMGVIDISESCRDSFLNIISLGISHRRACQNLTEQYTSEQLLRALAERFIGLPCSDLEHSVHSSLEEIGGFLGAEGAFLIMLSPDKDTVSSKRVWGHPNSAISEDWLSQIPHETLLWLIRELLARKTVLFPNVAAMPPEAIAERKNLMHPGLGALACAALEMHGETIGVLGVLASVPRYDWNKQAASVLQNSSGLLGKILSHQRSDEALLNKVSALEEVVNRSDARYSSIFESLAEGLIMADGEGILTYCNRRFCEITGYPRDEIIGRRVYDVFFGKSKGDMSEVTAQMHKRYQARKRGISEEYELEITRKDGEVRWVQVRAAPLRDYTGNIVGSIGMNTDITEQKHLEEQLRWSQKMEAVGRLAGGIAHDFNNLLTVMNGYSKLLLKRIPEDDPNRRQIDAIREASEAAGTLTQQLLTVSRRQITQPKVLDLNEVVLHMTGILKSLIGEGITLTTELREGLSPVRIDPGQLQQVIMNLAVNARDAMPDGGTLSIATRDYTVGENGCHIRPALDPGEYIVVTVSDTGRGMDAHVQAHLFEPFFSTKRAGTGLGLSTTYGIVKQHGGNISVDSEEGVGSTFTAYFKKSDLDVLVLDTVREGGVWNSRGCETILLVEDEEAVRELVCEILERSGYTVVQAPHGGAALEILASEENKFDFLLTDIVMPHVGGFEVAEKVMSTRPGMKLMMMSGCINDESISEKITTLGIPFISKPFSPESLTQRVREVLDGGAPLSVAAPSRAA